MKRKICLAVLVCLLLAGCGGPEEYRVSTVVYIPVAPTEAYAPEMEETVLPETETQAQTEPETEPEMTEEVPETTEPAKKPSSGKSSKKKPSKKETEPPATEPPVTEPWATEPPATEPPATEPPATEPPTTEPLATESPATEPPETEPPASEPEPTDPPLYDISGYSVGSLEKAMKKAINAYRTEEDLGELKLSSRLCAIASCRAYETSQVWSHTRPDGRGYGSVLSDYGYGAGSVKELLVYVSGSGSAGDIVDKWMASDSHAQLLLGDYTTVGIGVYRSGGYTYVACLLVR